MSYYVARVLGQVFANAPYYVLRCVVFSEGKSEPKTVKGKIIGNTERDSIIIFQGKEVDENYQGTTKTVLEVVKSPIDPKMLKGLALNEWQKHTSPEKTKTYSIASQLVNCGIAPKTLNSIWSVISRNPQEVLDNAWLLVDYGIPFKTADQIALTLNPDSYSLTNNNRIKASIKEAIHLGVLDGNCYLDSNSIFDMCHNLTGEKDINKIALIIKEMVNDKQIIIEKASHGNAIYLPSIHRMETEVVSYLTNPNRRKGQREEISYIKSHSKYDLTNDQIEAIQRGLIEPISIVSGLPGTGKTTILSVLCSILKEKKEQLLLVAPTGIASKRLASVVKMDAMTIHRAFGAGNPGNDDKSLLSTYEGLVKDKEENVSNTVSRDSSREHWTYTPNNPRQETVLIVDEASMVDLHLLWRLLRGITENCRVIFVGDVAQLPPVGAGFTLADMMSSGRIPSIHLTKIFRQGEGSGVVIASHDVYNGVVPSTNNEFIFLNNYSNSDILQTIKSLCLELEDEETDYHIISPTHHGDLGCTNLNKVLRAKLNPTISSSVLRIGNDEIREHDKIMITQNDYDLGVFNGDLGKVFTIRKDSVDVILRSTGTSSMISIPKDKVSSLMRLAYATTVHKSQGQEYQVIIMPIVREFGNALLQRNLIYTAITRAKVKAYLIGDIDALASGVANTSTKVKFSRLKDKLFTIK